MPPLLPKPPRPPWQKIPVNKDSGGYLSIYYSDDMSPLAVRWVTKPGDNKSDPNLETLTYGLFSTCSKAMRAGIVNKGAEYLFFATRRGQGRALAGYYHLKWFAVWPHGEKDYSIAADAGRFVETPIPLEKVDHICKTDVSQWFRTTRILDRRQCLCLANLIDKFPDATNKYISEIDRLERFNLRYGGYRYIGWRQAEKFDWAFAEHYLSPHNGKQIAAQLKNSTQSNRWTCVECSKVTINKALLKRCPHCGALGALRGN